MLGETSQARFAYIAEVTAGTTPSTPTFKVMRVTGAGLQINKSTVTSDEIQPDRNVRDEALVGIDVAGSYGFELTYGSQDDLLESALRGTWASDVLKNGIARKTFSVEETLELGATDSFSRFVRAEVNTMSLNIPARGKVTGSFGMMARSEALATAIISGATYTAANTKPMMTASAHVAELTIGSISPAPKVRNLTLEINNNLRTRPVVGSLYSEDLGAGKCDVTGTIEAYFESNALYQAVLDHGNMAVSATIGVDTNEKYTIALPKVIFLNGQRQLGGVNDDVMVSIPFRAVYDATAAASIVLTRAVA